MFPHIHIIASGATTNGTALRMFSHSAVTVPPLFLSLLTSWYLSDVTAMSRRHPLCAIALPLRRTSTVNVNRKVPISFRVAQQSMGTTTSNISYIFHLISHYVQSRLTWKLGENPHVYSIVQVTHVEHVQQEVHAATLATLGEQATSSFRFKVESVVVVSVQAYLVIINGMLREERHKELGTIVLMTETNTQQDVMTNLAATREMESFPTINFLDLIKVSENKEMEEKKKEELNSQLEKKSSD
ncbi:hypothetical protein Scep_007429 [Stephania cephalantha]|uniref:Uncharacterized protein n=1 Tax=Stephania cephalantha TaxID=152367 RepID=A0AAP0PLS9_9MAGN